MADQGDLKSATAEFDEAIRLDDKNGDAHAARAQCYLRTGAYDKALADLDEAIRRDAKLWTAHAFRGVILAKKLDHQRALHEYNEAVRVAPKSASRGLREPSTTGYARTSRALSLTPTRRFVSILAVKATSQEHRSRLNMATLTGHSLIWPSRSGATPRMCGGSIFERVVCSCGRNSTRRSNDVDEVLRLDPKNAAASEMRSALLVLTSHPENELTKALVDYDRAVALKPNDDAIRLERREGPLQPGRF